MLWIGALFQLSIFVSGGLCFTSLQDHSWLWATAYAILGYLLWLAMNVEVVADLEDE